MAPSDSEDDNLEDLVFDEDQDGEGDDEQVNDGVPDDVTEEGADDSESDTSDSGSDDDEEDEEELDIFADAGMDIDVPDADEMPGERAGSTSTSELVAEIEKSETPPSPVLPPAPPPPEIPRKRSLSPAGLRRKGILAAIGHDVPPGIYTVEAICALPHPVPTHSLASSFCMTHLLTGSEDGYIRDYDIFPSVNGKSFLTAPQRHHSGVVEGIMKSGQLRYWWENPLLPMNNSPADPLAANDEGGLAPVYSIAVHSDALWAITGSDAGHINLFTVRHEPGRRFHDMAAHRGPVSALAIDYDEKGFFSAGWDGDAIQWDLNTGKEARRFVSHGAQLAAIAIRPQGAPYVDLTPPQDRPNELDTRGLYTMDTKDPYEPNQIKDEPMDDKDDDAKSSGSHDSLFDDDDGGEEKPAIPTLAPKPVLPQKSITRQAPAPAPKNAPPLLEHSNYSAFSPDTLLTASIDGQVILWDRRVNTPGAGVGRLWMSEKTPPWCLSACWSWDGGQVYAGRRNGTVDVWDVRLLGQSGPKNLPRVLKVLRNPASSGVVSCVASFPDCKHVACASVDNLRLWNVAEAPDADSFAKPKGGLQFKIIPGHHGGYISQLLVDPGARFLISASSNRGWHGESTKTVFVHDIKRDT